MTPSPVRLVLPLPSVADWLGPEPAMGRRLGPWRPRRRVVAGDRDLLDITTEASIKIVNPRGFWDLLRKGKPLSVKR
jgi:hypothetical protein